MKKNYSYFILPALAVIILDQISKLLVVEYIQRNQAIGIIENFFSLVHIRNRGIAFGLLNKQEPGLIFYALVAVTIAAIILVFVWFVTLKGKDRLLIPGLSLIAGGAMGNLIDRLRLKEVIDFLDFYVGGYHWPAFNLADSSITIGTLWVAVNLLFLGASER